MKMAVQTEKTSRRAATLVNPPRLDKKVPVITSPRFHQYTKMHRSRQPKSKNDFIKKKKSTKSIKNHISIHHHTYLCFKWQEEKVRKKLRKSA